jgi:hypothetical protein
VCPIFQLTWHNSIIVFELLKRAVGLPRHQSLSVMNCGTMYGEPVHLSEAYAVAFVKVKESDMIR